MTCSLPTALGDGIIHLVCVSPGCPARLSLTDGEEYDLCCQQLRTSYRKDNYGFTGHVTIKYIMTSSNRNIFCVTGLLCREFTGHQWIPHIKASGMELWCFFSIWARINGWVNNHEAGDLRCHCAHYDVIVMSFENVVCEMVANLSQPQCVNPDPCSRWPVVYLLL